MKPNIPRVMDRKWQGANVEGVLDTWERISDSPDHPQYFTESSDGLWSFVDEPSDQTCHVDEVITYLKSKLED